MVLVLGVIAGCIPFRPVVIDDDRRFDLEGRVNIRTATDAVTANFRWQQFGSSFVIDFWGALGQGRTRITGRRGELVVTAGDGTTLQGEDAKNVVGDILGESSLDPSVFLASWVQMRPVPREGISDEVHDETGRLVEFVQRGWTVRATRHHMVDGVEMPRRVIMSNNETKLTVICRKWTLYG